jgi:opacity protein-like surface antigen
MRRQTAPILIFLLALGALAAPAEASGDANLIYGQKSLSGTPLESAGVDGQSEIGIALSLDFEWPVMLAVDLLTSSDDNTITIPVQGSLEYWTDVETTELGVGVRKFWGQKRFRPYVGGGLAYVKLDALQIESGDLGFPGTEYRQTIVDDSDSAIGFWLNTGFIYRVGQYLNVGIDIRHSDADADLLPFDTDTTLNLDSGGTHYGVLFGYRW